MGLYVGKIGEGTCQCDAGFYGTTCEKEFVICNPIDNLGEPLALDCVNKRGSSVTYTCKNDGNDCYCGAAEACICNNTGGHCYCEQAMDCNCLNEGGSCCTITSDGKNKDTSSVQGLQNFLFGGGPCELPPMSGLISGLIFAGIVGASLLIVSMYFCIRAIRIQVRRIWTKKRNIRNDIVLSSVKQPHIPKI